MSHDTLSTGSARAAAGRLRDALDRHLAAVEARSSEHDPEVQRAYRELRSAAAEYDLALYREHDEVTPFDLPDPTPEPTEDEEVTLERLSLLARWDYSVTDPDVLMEAARRAISEDVDHEGIALAALVATAGHNRVAASAASLGLRAHGSTTWVFAADDAEPEDDDPSWMDDAFGGADPDRALCRLDAPVETD